MYLEKIFKSLRTVCKETKLREFQFKFIHRTVVTKGELSKYGIKRDDECCFCGTVGDISIVRSVSSVSNSSVTE